MADRRLKLGASPSFHLPDLTGVVPGLTPDPPDERRIESTYHDTADLRIARWGGSLRHRPDGWLLRLPAAGGGRRELRFNGRGTTVPAQVLRLLAAFRLGEPLQPVARLSTWRRRVRFRDGAGEQVLEVVDDEVSVLEGRRVAARFRELEILSSQTGEPVDLDPLLERLRAAGAGAEEAVPKLVRAIGPPAQRAPDLQPGPPGQQATLGEAVRGSLATAAAALLVNDSALWLGDDPDAIRRARVAARRLRSRLRTFDAYIDREWSAELAEELRWLADELGAIRDLDVRAARLERHAALVDDGDRRVVMSLAAVAAAEAGAARGRVPGILDSTRYLQLLERVAGVASAPLVDAGERAAADALPGLVRRRWKRLRRDVRALADEPDAVQLHAVRISAKQARYAAEAAGPFAPAALELANALAAVQDALGEHHDSDSARAWLRETARVGRRAFVAGVLYEIEREAQATALRDFRRAWRAARRPRLRKWM